MESLRKDLSHAETKIELAEANLNLMKKEAENIRLKIQIEASENMGTTPNGEHVWEEFPNVDVGAGDDYVIMLPSTSLEDVKAKCIELGSHFFVAKVGCQKYIRSPPGGRKKNKDYQSVLNAAMKRKTEGPSSTYTTYICNYTPD